MSSLVPCCKCGSDALDSLISPSGTNFWVSFFFQISALLRRCKSETRTGSQHSFSVAGAGGSLSVAILG